MKDKDKNFNLAKRIWNLKQKGYSIYKIAKTLNVNNSIVSFVINYTHPYFYTNANKLKKLEILSKEMKKLEDQLYLFSRLLISIIVFTFILNFFVMLGINKYIYKIYTESLISNIFYFVVGEVILFIVYVVLIYIIYKVIKWLGT